MPTIIDGTNGVDKVATGTVGLTQLSATGTPSSSNYLRGDNTWATVASSQWTTTGSDIYYNTGNVLVGNTNAATKLSVKPASDTYQLYLMQGNQTNDGWKQWAEGNNGDLTFSRSTSNTDVERLRITAAGNLQFNSGYGSVATAYGVRAWVSFNSDGSIRAGGNVSSVSVVNSSSYNVNLTTAMPDTNYSVQWTVNVETNHFAIINSTSQINCRSGGSFSIGYMAIFR
jgi:hypothetical protein